MVSHRFSTVRKGRPHYRPRAWRIVEHGTHDELMTKKMVSTMKCLRLRLRAIDRTSALWGHTGDRIVRPFLSRVSRRFWVLLYTEAFELLDSLSSAFFSWRAHDRSGAVCGAHRPFSQIRLLHAQIWLLYSLSSAYLVIFSQSVSMIILRSFLHEIRTNHETIFTSEILQEVELLEDPDQPFRRVKMIPWNRFDNHLERRGDSYGTLLPKVKNARIKLSTAVSSLA